MSVVKLLDNSASRYPDKTAVIDDENRISYKDFQQISKSVGSYILNKGYQPNSPILVYMKKGWQEVSSFMGILYSGNYYVPIAFDMPVSRIEKIAENLSPVLIITDAECYENVQASSELKNIDCVIFGSISETKIDEKKIALALKSVIDTDPVYIMYTSGSTGVPKGVVVTHRGVRDYAEWTTTEFGFTKDDIFGNQAPFYFDNSIFDIYSALLVGATMVIIPEVLFNFPLKLPQYLRDMDITVIFWVPTVMINIANSGALEGIEMPSLKKVLFCGEVMPNTQLNIWRKHFPDLMYANLYGPTEITDVCMYYVVDREFNNSDPLPIGKACRNMRFTILNDEDKIAKTNEVGELCVSGSGVSLGYYNNPDTTAKVYIQNPVNSTFTERFYRTGDLAYVNDEGLVIFIGRKDSQIKIKGNRVELGEIENAAMCVPDVEGACAVYDAEKIQIVLFVESKAELKLRTFNNLLKAYIPKYMLPSKLIVMDKFPHTANDKIDRVTLKKMIND